MICVAELDRTWFLSEATITGHQFLFTLSGTPEILSDIERCGSDFDVSDSTWHMLTLMPNNTCTYMYHLPPHPTFPIGLDTTPLISSFEEKGVTMNEGKKVKHIGIIINNIIYIVCMIFSISSIIIFYE